ncbi:hypothetical protein EVAR_24950_1 [Eumeta japonica]|uniref:Uncharacterized protein n=1 Tax=Eumeta variegata TaxID=151549 RepID=A0A4C2A2R7_EUMVA|nr:hypothetical protein EVAR_24950_1 [Eumeta japonica]
MPKFVIEIDMVLEFCKPVIIVLHVPPEMYLYFGRQAAVSRPPPALAQRTSKKKIDTELHWGASAQMPAKRCLAAVHRC